MVHDLSLQYPPHTEFIRVMGTGTTDTLKDLPQHDERGAPKTDSASGSAPCQRSHV